MSEIGSDFYNPLREINDQKRIRGEKLILARIWWAWTHEDREATYKETFGPSRYFVPIEAPNDPPSPYYYPTGIMEEDIPSPPEWLRKPALDKRLGLASQTIFSHAQWDVLLARSIEQIQSLATVKGGEYAGDSDRLANFRRNGQALGLPMEVVWSIYYNKHHDAVMQYVKDLSSGTTRKRAEPLSGRVDDMIVYLLLLKAILIERGEA